MTPNPDSDPTSGLSNTTPTVRWAELRPDDFRTRRDACPLVYLPVGLCEPHGHIASLGLDLIKADAYCDTAAARYGGIVAPSQGYHIHECGFHGTWLAEVVGDENPLLAALPPDVMLRLFLYQLRAFANASFKAVLVVSGHGGGSQEDLRRVAAVFTTRTGMPVHVKTDAELVAGRYIGDHAGRYEISQLLALRPDLVDLKLLNRRHEPGSGGRLAQGDDAGAATASHGHEINAAIIAALGREATDLLTLGRALPPIPFLDYVATEEIWEAVSAAGDWHSNSP